MNIDDTHALEPNPACPLCRSADRFKKRKTLYGCEVCSKCYYRFANLRQLAYLLDVICFSIVVGLIAAAVAFAFFAAFASSGPAGPGGSGSSSAFGPQDLVFFALLFVIALFTNALFACKDGFNGHSPFKAVLGVQTIDTQTGQPIGFGKSFKRNLPHVGTNTLVGQIPIAGGLISLAIYITLAVQLCKGPRWGDGWANTRVIWKKYANHPVFNNTTRCEGCGYDLRATTGSHCPECGNAIDADKRRTIDQAAAASPATTAGPAALSEREPWA